MTPTRLAVAGLSILVTLLIGVVRWLAREHRLTPRQATTGDADKSEDAGTKRGVLGYLLGGSGALVVLVSIVGLILSQLQLRSELALTQEGQLGERYDHAIEQLSNPRLPIRLAGIYELEQVALTSPQHYQLGIEFLGDYLRVVAAEEGAAATPGPVRPTLDREHVGCPPAGSRQSAEIRAVLTVLARRPRDRQPTTLDLSGVDLRHQNLQGLNLRGEKLTGAQFDGADLSHVNLSDADLTDAHFSCATLTSAQLPGATLTGADFSAATLSMANLQSAILSRAILIGADVDWTDVRRAKLQAADIAFARFDNADLTGANLADANLTSVCFFSTELIGAYVGNANISRTDFTMADLSGADLETAYSAQSWQFTSAVTDDSTKLPRQRSRAERPLGAGCRFR